jgi:translocation and assembly module TamA
VLFNANSRFRVAATFRACAVTLIALSCVAANRAGCAATLPEPAAVTAEPAYRVAIDAPPELKPAIERSVGLVRWQSYADMTVELMERLAREAQDEARGVTDAEGYFSAKVEIAIDRGTKPMTVTLIVSPGERTRIASVTIDVTGPATSDAPLGIAAIAKARVDWGLAVGQVFRQEAWTAAKERAVATLQASPYAAARIVASKASIDPGTRTADLAVGIDSGPAFRFGGLEIQGLDRYGLSIPSNFSTIKRGDPYTGAALEQYVRRLNSSGYFSSVQAAIDPDPAHPEDATIRIAVIEAPTRTFEGGIGYSTDVRYTAKVNYRDVNIDRRGLQLLADGEIDTRTQAGTLRFTEPPNAAGLVGTWGFGAKRTDIAGLITQTASTGTRWHTVEERRERAASATFYLDDQHPENAPFQRTHATYVEAEQYLREVDRLLGPTQGWMASAQLGAGVPGLSTRTFGRVIGRFAAWFPFDRANEVDVRAAAGAVLAPTRSGIPSTLLFRTGGDSTVRGYAFESLGVTQGDAVVGGRYYAAGSVEAIHWFSESLGAAAFVDAGNASDSLTGFRFALGYGAGMRVRTPVGPFRLDVAYGRDTGEIRLHFSVGISF